MRGYMYARGYRNLTAAKDAVRSLRLEAMPCSGCEACTVQCPQRIDVRRRALEVVRLEALPDEFLA
jgi:predicted aldo/keto reductase-like oxidoreductase